MTLPLSAPNLIDPFGRRIDYLRVSVTDRCNLRCLYCMPARMKFLPKAEVLTLAELDRLCSAFIRQGVRHLRLTGGEPLARPGFLGLVENLSRHLQSGALDELTLTTNGVRLAEFASGLAAAGVRRINISLDTLNRATFARIARTDQFEKVLAGIVAAQKAGISIKINTVALKRDNAAELATIIRWAHAEGLDISLIETMPLGAMDEDRCNQFLSLADVRRDLSSFWTLVELDETTSGPARYVRIAETGGKLGFITPMTHNFCAACHRVRLTCTGQLYLCLGQSATCDLRQVLREEADEAALDRAIAAAMRLKPWSHDFALPIRGAAPALARAMSMTGG
jgi:cyclic pyranopterin phosphate synthase